ncbi:hypothetical protein [Cellulomonas uda]|uniref:Uncharacterized protein n=1 Tax=Cellulomonas uda TaxID=1714 RepID=A0A4Y3KAC9_CELUD|nr:hypothetical protein [Cellulomonas uda]NII67808.1 hypothetical protein [Cellulomonas uda]GEA79945.1 hypothetical protein CUD01_03890 [Cellulomonas uda]
MAREVTEHGASGYRRGCKCEVCREGHRVQVARWRASRREREFAKALADASGTPLVETPAPEPVAAAGALDMDAAPGPLEAALIEDITEPDSRVAFRRHLVGLARLNARVLDQVSRLDRYDLISPVQLRQLEILNRIARIGFAGLDDDATAGGTVEVPDDASALLAELEGGE